jgi:hypothetical protein
VLTTLAVRQNGRSGGAYGPLRDRQRLSGDRVRRHKPKATNAVTVTAATLDSIAVMARILSINHIGFALNGERNELYL